MNVYQCYFISCFISCKSVFVSSFLLIWESIKMLPIEWETDSSPSCSLQPVNLSLPSLQWCTVTTQPRGARWPSLRTISRLRCCLSMAPHTPLPQLLPYRPHSSGGSGVTVLYMHVRSSCLSSNFSLFTGSVTDALRFSYLFQYCPITFSYYLYVPLLTYLWDNLMKVFLFEGPSSNK